MACLVQKPRAMSPTYLLRSQNRAGFVGLLAIVASFVAHAEGPQAPAATVPPAPVEASAESVTQPAPTKVVPTQAPTATPSATASTSVVPKAQPGFRGSSLSYGHQATAYTFDRAAEPMYNPTWSQRLRIAPEWHFNDLLFVRGRLSLAQEFTASDSTRRRNEVELSDLAFEFGVTGLTIPVAKILVGADLRIAFPTSKTSRSQTRLLSLAPGISLSRSLGFGLTVGYGGRFSYRFHRFTTSQNESPAIACADPLSLECLGQRNQDVLNKGVRNAHSDLTHGPKIAFSPFEKLSINAGFQLSHQWLYPLSPTPAELPAIAPAVDTPVDNYTSFDLSVTWQLVKPIGITFGASTFSPQLNTSGTRYFPLFNRNTTLYLDLSFDIEAATSGLFGEST